MPRIPIRTKIPVPDVLKNVPVFPRDRDHKCQPPDSPEERALFWMTVVKGLLKRLKRCDEGEARVAQAAIDMAWYNSWPWARQVDGVEAAREDTFELVADLSKKELNTLMKPAPLKLLGEYQDLVNTMPAQATFVKRRDWLLKQGVDQQRAEELAAYQGAELAEFVIAYRHKMSVSQLHKTLAIDGKRLKALLARKGGY